MPIVMDLGFGEDGMLEIMERLANKQHGDTKFTQVQAPGGKTLFLLDCS
jgi:hypothetical protein